MFIKLPGSELADLLDVHCVVLRASGDVVKKSVSTGSRIAVAHPVITYFTDRIVFHFRALSLLNVLLYCIICVPDVLRKCYVRW